MKNLLSDLEPAFISLSAPQDADLWFRLHLHSGETVKLKRTSALKPTPG